jgi:putative endonuclease
MPTVYIIYSKSIDSYYTGCCMNISKRLNEHNNGKYSNSFTGKAKDWEVYYLVENLELTVALRIEKHIKRMKSRRYIENIKLYPEIIEKLILKYDV